MRNILTLIFIAAAATLLLSAFVPRDLRSSRQIDFRVTPGEGTRDIALNLEKQRLIYWAPLFRLFVLTAGISNSLQAGTYELSPDMTPLEIALKFSSGDVKTQTVTVIEGWNLRDIGLALESRSIVRAERFWEAAGFPGADPPSRADFSSDYPFLAQRPSFVNLEGYLFPDTYQISHGASASEVIAQMLSNFETKTAPLKDRLAQKGQSMFEVLTIASLLEKEVRTLEDKKMVAGVIQNRLQIGMALQIDATVSYLTGRKDTALTAEELKIDSLYNTYQYPGLPLGPIANPGIESLEAALSPTDNPYFYYLSTKDGETIFSRTLEEHNKAKAEHL